MRRRFWPRTKACKSCSLKPRDGLAEPACYAVAFRRKPYCMLPKLFPKRKR
ncbi:UNVERIFIED_CONTAM: hypothetical protein GTU68_038996 [Idotea baltica]|nr:hypothetical protein [Idotea baltica]